MTHPIPEVAELMEHVREMAKARRDGNYLRYGELHDDLQSRLVALASKANRWDYIRRKICFNGNGDGTASMHAINLPVNAAWPELGKVAEGVDAAIDTAIQKEPRL